MAGIACNPSRGIPEEVWGKIVRALTGSTVRTTAVPAASGSGSPITGKTISLHDRSLKIETPPLSEARFTICLPPT